MHLDPFSWLDDVYLDPIFCRGWRSSHLVWDLKAIETCCSEISKIRFFSSKVRKIKYRVFFLPFPARSYHLINPFPVKKFPYFVENNSNNGATRAYCKAVGETRSLNRGPESRPRLGSDATFFWDSCSNLEIDENFRISHNLGLGLAAKISQAFSIQLLRYREWQ